MPYRNLVFAAGEHYHIYNRGVAKQPIFLDPDDYHSFIQSLHYYANKLEITLLAYCLLPNQYHLFVRQEGEAPAGKLAQYTCYAHSRRFNRRHGRQGTLFQGRYGARHISEESDAQHLCAYIHANPAVAGLVEQALDWPYSDLASWLRPGRLADPKRGAIADLFSSGSEYSSFLQGVLEKKMYSDGGDHW